MKKYKKRYEEKDIPYLTEEELNDILLTVDGLGKETKKLALNELISRAKERTRSEESKERWLDE